MADKRVSANHKVVEDGQEKSTKQKKLETYPGNQGICSKIWGYLSVLTVEPVVFFYAIGTAAISVTNVNLLEYKICKFDEGYTQDICDNFLDDEFLKLQKIQIQETLSNYNTIVEYVTNIPALLWCLVIGAWSDKHGRKKPILGVLILKAMSAAGFLMCSQIEAIPTYGVVLSIVPSALFGGFIFTLCLSYICDITTSKNRTTRIALLSGLSFLGYPLGTLLGGEIYNKFHFKGVYLCSILSLIISFTYGMIRIVETRTQHAPMKTVIKDLFQISNFLDGVKTVRKKREGHKKKYLYLSFVILGLNNAVLIGTEYVQYQYSQLAFNWNVSNYTRFSSVGQFFNKFVNVFITPALSSKLHFTESTIGFIGMSFTQAALFTKLLCRIVPLFYISEFMFGLLFIAVAAARSILSKSVNENELGQAFGFAGAVEAVGSLIFSPVNQQIYRATLSFFPSFSFVIAFILSIPTFSIFLWMDINKRVSQLMEKKKSKDADEEPKDVGLTEIPLDVTRL